MMALDELRQRIEGEYRRRTPRSRALAGIECASQRGLGRPDRSERAMVAGSDSVLPVQHRLGAVNTELS